MTQFKIVLCGPPHSGKSVLRDGLKKALIRLQSPHYPYVITCAPDGEGVWFQETFARSPEEAKKLKEEYKKSLGGFSPEAVQRYASWVQNCPLPLVFIDVGGKITPENKKICGNATHAIIIFGEFEKLSEWRAFCKELGLKIIAEIYSDYHGKNDIIIGVGPDGVFRGSVHYLERGEDVSERPTIVALAKYIISLLQSTP